MMKTFYLLLLVLTVVQLRSQDLVPNGSFEKYSTCPEQLNTGFPVYPGAWYSPTEATPDYFNACSNGMAGVPQNALGQQNPRTGKAYMGIVAFAAPSAGYGEYREYIQAKLSDSLKKDALYCITFYVSLAHQSDCGSVGLGAALTKEAICLSKSLATSMGHITYSSPLGLDTNRSIAGDTGWVMISGVYKAKGGEQYITIGSFSKGTAHVRKKPKYPRPDLFTTAYYYVDDVSVKRVKSQFECGVANQEIVLNNILFKTGKNDLLSSSYKELDQLVAALKQNAVLKAEIAGHTDNTGQEKSNRALSEARAKAVADYILSKGIDKSRITYKGYGSAKPVATNATPEGKQQNRRVAVTFR
jgi:outer membrane protein OmpA-like peptidoglycan-associated protein